MVQKLSAQAKGVRTWLTKHGLYETAILGGLCVIAILTWGFIEIAEEVRENGHHHLDEWLLTALRDPRNPKIPIGPAFLLESARDITALGGVTVLALVTLACAGFLWLQRKRRAMCLLLVSVLGGLAASGLLKQLFQRERPTVVPHLVTVQSLSFPSGHSMLSAVVYLTLGALLLKTVADRASRIYVLAWALLLPVLIGASRVYLGVHYPTDVLAGWCAGLAWAVLCSVVAEWLQNRGAVEPPGTPSAPEIPQEQAAPPPKP